MTTTTTAIDSTIELGHPVRSFVLALFSIGLVLVAVQWSGFANPQVHATDSSGSFNDGPANTFSIGVQNDSPLPVEVVQLDWPTTNMVSVEVGIIPSSGDSSDVPSPARLEPFTPFTLASGEIAWLGIRMVPDCSATVGPPRVEVRTVSGLRHPVELDRRGFDVGDRCA